jgi:hypothetical protein
MGKHAQIVLGFPKVDIIERSTSVKIGCGGCVMLVHSEAWREGNAVNVMSHSTQRVSFVIVIVPPISRSANKDARIIRTCKMRIREVPWELDIALMGIERDFSELYGVF